VIVLIPVLAFFILKDVERFTSTAILTWAPPMSMTRTFTALRSDFRMGISLTAERPPNG